MSNTQHIRERIANIDRKIKSCGNELKQLLMELDENPVPKRSAVQIKAEQIKSNHTIRRKKPA